MPVSPVPTTKTVINYTPYCQWGDILADTGGVDVADIGNENEANGILRRASAMVDGFCRSTFQYRSQTNPHYEELQEWVSADRSGPVWKGQIFFNRRPVRKIISFNIDVGLGADGNPVSASIPCTPLGTSPGNNLPPVGQGYVYINRADGWAMPVYIVLRFGLYAAVPSLAIPPTARVTYTCGFDPPATNGQVQDDGYSVPLPFPIFEATRITALALCTEKSLNEQGLAGAEMARQGDQMLRRTTKISGAPEFDIPLAAERVLKGTPYRRYNVR